MAFRTDGPANARTSIGARDASVPNLARRCCFILAALAWLLPPVVADSHVPPPDPRRCVCPIGADGHCECVTCNLLGIHGERRAVATSTGPTLSGCTTDSRDAGALGSPELPALCATVVATIAPPTVAIRKPPPAARRREGPVPPRIERPPRAVASRLRVALRPV